MTPSASMASARRALTAYIPNRSEVVKTVVRVGLEHTRVKGGRHFSRSPWRLDAKTNQLNSMIPTEHKPWFAFPLRDYCGISRARSCTSRHFCNERLGESFITTNS